MLRPEIFKQITHSLGNCTLDLFASSRTAQLPRYVSWRHDPQSAGMDAFLVPWAKERLWAFPPIALIGRVLQRLQQEGGRMLLLTPDWPSQPWWPALFDMATREPLRISHPVLLQECGSRSGSQPPFAQGLVWDLSLPSQGSAD